MTASQGTASAYQVEADWLPCSKATVQTKGNSSPGSIQRHTHNSTSHTFPPVYGLWYDKFYNAGYTSANWKVEALNNGGAIGYLNFSKTYAYCIW